MDKLINCGCGGKPRIAKKILMGNLPDVYVFCENCSIKTKEYYSVTEAIMAWNTAMGERTAKVSNQIFNNSNPYTVGAWIGTCECGELISYSSKYCHMCGAKLDWSGNE